MRRKMLSSLGSRISDSFRAERDASGSAPNSALTSFLGTVSTLDRVTAFNVNRCMWCWFRIVSIPRVSLLHIA